VGSAAGAIAHFYYSLLVSVSYRLVGVALAGFSGTILWFCSRIALLQPFVMQGTQHFFSFAQHSVPSPAFFSRFWQLSLDAAPRPELV
jgi:hypothetical protein